MSSRPPIPSIRNGAVTTISANVARTLAGSSMPKMFICGAMRARKPTATSVTSSVTTIGAASASPTASRPAEACTTPAVRSLKFGQPLSGTTSKERTTAAIRNVWPPMSRKTALASSE